MDATSRPRCVLGRGALRVEPRRELCVLLQLVPETLVILLREALKGRRILTRTLTKQQENERSSDHKSEETAAVNRSLDCGIL